MPDWLGRMFGPYRILERIGSGGMGTVYKAYQTGPDRLVAIKVLPDQRALDPIFLRRFQLEVQLISQLEHRAIVPVYDAGFYNEQPYLAMRYLCAGTVGDLLLRGPLSLPDAARILTDVATALDYAHARGIIHRDIKPNNVLVDRDGHAYLTDFGLAKAIEVTGNVTRSGETLGTPTYMAPEQTLGRPVTVQSDVYSLGVMLYEMIAGHPPYSADTPIATALMHVQSPLPSLRLAQPSLPDSIEAVLQKALAKEPAERYQTAGELAQAFSTVVNVTAPSQALTLPILASEIALAKSDDQITPGLRRHLRTLDRREQWRKTRRWLPRVVGAALVLLALLGLYVSFTTIQSGRASADLTATAITDLLNQLSAARTAVAGGQGTQVQRTLEYLETQAAQQLVAPATTVRLVTTTPSTTATISATATALVTRTQPRATATAPPADTAPPATAPIPPTPLPTPTATPSSAPTQTNTLPPSSTVTVPPSATLTPPPTVTATLRPPTPTPTRTSILPTLPLPTLPLLP